MYNIIKKKKLLRLKKQSKTVKNIVILILSMYLITACKSSAKKSQTYQNINSTLQIVAKFDTRPGNVAVNKDGRLFTTMHPLDNSNYQLVEIIKGNKEPFPNESYQKNGGKVNHDKLDAPLGIRIDKNNVLWIIDTGQNLGKTRLFGFDISLKKEIFRLDFPLDIAPKGSLVQDLAVDEKNGWIYLADASANPGILAVNINKKTIRRFEDNHVKSEDINLVINGKVINFLGAPARVGINPITLSNDRNTLFFGAMNGTKWYSIPTNLFREEKNDNLISKAIKEVGTKPISDGAATDKNGNHYFTNLQDKGLDVLTSGELKPLIRDTSIDWPDNITISSDGWLYFVVNQLHKTPVFTGGDDLGQKPFYIKRIKL